MFCSFLSFLGDEYLGGIFANYTYLFLWCAFFVQIKLFLNAKKEKKDNRFSLTIFRKLNSEKTNLIILFFLNLLLFKALIFIPGNIEIGDFNFSINRANVISTRFFWIEQGSFTGGSNAQLAIFSLINSPLKFLKFSSEFSIKIVFLEIIFTSLLSLYFLAQKILQKFIHRKIFLNLSVLLVSVFYLFNPYTLNRIFHFYHWIPYCFLPLIFLVFLKFLETKKIYYVVILAFLLNFIAFSPHFLVYAFIAMGLFSIVSLAKWIGKIGFVTDKKRSIREGFKVILGGIIFMLCFTLFSAHWLIPYLKNSLMQGSAQAPGYMLTKEYIEPASEGLKNKAKEVFQTLALNPDTTDSKILNFFLKIFTYLLPFLLFLPLFKGLRNKYTVFFSILGILAGTISILPILNYALYQKILFDIPYLNNFNWLFREAYRINGLLAFAYSFLFGFLFLKLLQMKFNQVKLFCLIIFGLFIFWGGMIWWII